MTQKEIEEQCLSLILDLVAIECDRIDSEMFELYKKNCPEVIER